MSIYNALRSIEANGIILQETIHQWVKLFLKFYQSKHFTPYLHTLIHHTCEFTSLHKSLAPFSQQGLECLNDCITKDYFRSTNHRNETLKVLMMKLNRIEELRH